MTKNEQQDEETIDLKLKKAFTEGPFEAFKKVQKVK